MPSIDTHTVTLMEVPLVQRLSKYATLLNYQIGLTEDVWGLNSTLLSSIPFSRGLYTYVARSKEEQAVGQFRYKTDEANAHLLYVASNNEHYQDDTVWLHLLDALTHAAGKHGAHNLVAEIEESHPLFEVMRQSGFAVYARQVIWKHSPEQELTQSNVFLKEETDHDQISITSLLTDTIPAIVYSVLAPSNDDETMGVIYRNNGRVDAYLTITEGKQGIYIIPYLHPDVRDKAKEILLATVQGCKQAHKKPVYICIRAYQGWINDIVDQLSFTRWMDQAVMVRHIAAGIRQTNFAKVQLQGAWRAVKTPVSPPARSIVLEHTQKEKSTL